MPLSEHCNLEISTVAHRGGPLEPGEPVPGCGCFLCTGIPTDDPVRMWRKRTAPGAPSGNDEQVEAARAQPIIDVARSLGLTPEMAGREWKCQCPLHQDLSPSLFFNPKKNLWFCFGCGEGGDGIRLVMKVLTYSFLDAVKALHR